MGEPPRGLRTTRDRAAGGLALQLESGRFGESGTRRETAVGAPAWGDNLLLVNRTPKAWTLDLGFHRLAVLEPEEERVVHARPVGTVTARQVDPSVREYLVITLDARVYGVEVYDTSGGEGYYGLRLLYPAGEVEVLHRDTPIEELNLPARVENALKGAGWTTVGDVAATSLEDLGRLPRLGARSLEVIVRRLHNVVVS